MYSCDSPWCLGGDFNVIRFLQRDPQVVGRLGQ